MGTSTMCPATASKDLAKLVNPLGHGQNARDTVTPTFNNITLEVRRGMKYARSP